MGRKEIIESVKNMKATDHVIFLYSNVEDKHEVLSAYLKAGLDKGEAAAYVTAEETTDEIKKAMRKHGIKVDRYERNGALKVIDYRDWYIIGGKFDIAATMDKWKRELEESKAKGLKGLRVTGEMICFFKEKMVDELLEYERSLHRVLDLPMTAICAYNEKEMLKEIPRKAAKIVFDLLKSHGAYLTLA